MKSVLIIPTYNAGPFWREVLAGIAVQSGAPDHKIIIDSGSTDDTVPWARAAGFEVLSVPKSEFDYGGTRQRAIDHAAGYDIVILLTQDVVLERPDALRKLMSPYADPEVAACYGRQLPRYGATAIEIHARLFNYPPRSHVREQADIPRLGFKCAFFSDAFGSYRRDALMAIGGFPLKTIFGEDVIAVGKMITRGYKVAYAADAECRHSHDYTFYQEFRRYFDIGAFHHVESWLLTQLGTPSGEGKRFVLSETRYLLRHAPLLVLSAWIRTLCKWLGYKAGYAHPRLSQARRRAWSMNQGYWK